MVERMERQTFAPKVAGSSPTGTHCERRGEKTLSGLLHSPAILCAVYVCGMRGAQYSAPPAQQNPIIIIAFAKTSDKTTTLRDG